MELNVQLFATARDIAQASEVTLKLPVGADVNDLKRALVALVPELEPLMKISVVAVNQEYATPDCLLSPGCEVALIPPVSGG